MNPFDIKPSDLRISADLAPEVLALAARLQAEQQSSYSLEELVEAGAEANIGPEHIRQAAQQIQAQQIQATSRSDSFSWLAKGGAMAAAIAIALFGMTLIGGSAGMGCHARMDAIESHR
ncbi:hypothetical protein IQ265_06360 [Nodosilinea sp. LEGE 06152]|uniref:hypothetical protein n=1 Tax=Nodosilinea sp. LEGE 06152 TaxID=2777966 RepID=UPI00187E23D4|nr:hypothetical protein [Nodosilinea sp. LEGE 06152]MBE9156452.1 hypothetical protein [Nodosilinea sp. LEGE 06152]